MSLEKQHIMVLSQEFPDGSQEWNCPTCGRRFIIQWPPNYKRTILEEGDNEVMHAGGHGGGIGGLNMGGSDVHAGESLPEEEALPAESLDEPVESVQADPYLEPFKAWLERRED